METAVYSPTKTEPLTIAAWFKSTSSTTDQCICAFHKNGTTGRYYELTAGGAVAGDPVRAQHRPNSSPGIADSTAGYSVNTWQHGCAVFATTTSRSAYVNGGNKGTNVANINASTVDRVRSGYSSQSTRPFAGDIGEVCIWSEALTDDEVLSLYRGVNPMRMRPLSIIGYWPVWGWASPEINVVGAKSMTLSGAPSATYGCPVSTFSLAMPISGTEMTQRKVRSFIPFFNG